MRRHVTAVVLVGLTGATRLAGAAPLPAECHARPALTVREITPDAADRLRLAPGTTRGRRAGEFVLRDGRVLVQDEAGGGGELYLPGDFAVRERELKEALRRRGVSEGAPFHPLRGLIDDGARFGTELPALVGALRSRLLRVGLPLAAAGVDELVARRRTARCSIDAALVRELTAWFGDALIAQLPAPAVGAPDTRPRWSTLAASDGTVEPVIEAAGSAGAAREPLRPWEMALRLLADPAAHATALLAEATADPAALASAAPAATNERP